VNIEDAEIGIQELPLFISNEYARGLVQPADLVHACVS
jgi:hypothetical protein